MRKLHHDQIGDAALTVLSFALIFTVVGFVGWRVWDARKSANAKLDAGDTQPAVAREQVPKVPEGFVEQKIAGTELTVNYPKTQDPIKDVSNEDDPKVNHPGRLAKYELKDFPISIYETKGLVMQIGVGAPRKCIYSKDNNTFTIDKANSYESAHCNFKTSSFDSVAFHDQSSGYESVTDYMYGAPLKGKNYFMTISSFRSDNDCYGNPDFSEEVCNARTTAQFESLNVFMREFVPANKALFQ